jgi:stress-induced morphogen
MGTRGAGLPRFETPDWRNTGMPMDAHDIESMIKAAIPDAEVTIRDLAGDGDHYAATVISESFRGKSRVQQHQIVYQSLRGQMGGVLHALALQTGVPGGPGVPAGPGAPER